jgi:site-specific DNA-cytosine methylase
MPKVDKPTAIGCYIFAGGFTVGMSRHLRVLAHLEDGRFGVGTFQRNFSHIPVIQKDGWDQAPVADIVYGNPPCSAWSCMGSLSDGHTWSKKRDWRQSRLDCSASLLGLWRSRQPKVWVMESVTPLLTKGREFVLSVVREASAAGYGMWVVLHDPKFMGVAQTRRRVFLVASRVHLEFPAPTGGITMLRDVMGEMPRPSRRIPVVDNDLHWWKKAPIGRDFVASWSISCGSPKTKPKHRTGHRLDPNTPMGTIHSDGHFAHPTQPRFLSGVELAYLSGFPVDYLWPESDTRIRVEVAKGVTPAAGEWLGRCLVTSLAKGGRANPEVVTVVNQLSRSPRRADDRMIDSTTVMNVKEFCDA